MINVFRCPRCQSDLAGWPPVLTCPSCGYVIQNDSGILIFSDEPSVALHQENTYIGYDPVAKGYAEFVYPPEVAEQIIRAYGKVIADLVDAERTLLDLGCGPGWYSLEVAKRGCQVVAGDISLSMLKLLSSRLQEAPVGSIIPCRLNAYDLPLLDQSVDAVLSLSVLPFLGSPAQAIQEIKRVLKPRGKFITDAYKYKERETSGEAEEILHKARLYYSEALQERGVPELSLLGWKTAREERENLARRFRHCSDVESDDLAFACTTTVKWFLDRLESRYTMFQVMIAPEIHAEVMREVRSRLALEFGSDVEQVKQWERWRDQLVVCSD